MKPNAARRTPWRALYRPDSAKTKWEALPSLLTTAEARADWAVRKSREIAKRKLELEGGAARATGTALSDAVDRYFAAHVRLSARSKLDYRAAADKLIEWAQNHRLRSADDLTRAKLMSFRESIINEPKRSVVKGGKRGARQEGADLRSPETVNGELRKVRTVLGYLRKVDLLPRLSNDDLRDGLQRIAVTYERIEYLKPAELRKLLEAAAKHDAETFNQRNKRRARGRRAAAYRHHAALRANSALRRLRAADRVPIRRGTRA